MNDISAKQALVLAGGASHGAYHVGVLQALMSNRSPCTNNVPLNPGIIAGISVGAFNAAVLLSRLEAGDSSPAASLERTWMQRIASTKRKENGVFRFRGDSFDLLNPRKVLRKGPRAAFSDGLADFLALSEEGLQRGRRFAASEGSLQERMIAQANLSSFMSTKPFEKTIRKSIDCGRLRRSRRTLRIGAVHWKSGLMRYFTGEDLTDDEGGKIVRASAAVPAIFPHVKVGGQWYCDGAAVENTPLAGAIHAGAEELHVVTSIPPVESIECERLPNTLDTLCRLLVIRESATLRKDMEHAGVINRSLNYTERTARDDDAGPRPFERAFAEVREGEAKDKPYKKIAVHVYHPPKSLGGIMSLLDFDRKFLASMIRKGYRDALNHDCGANGCVHP